MDAGMKRAVWRGMVAGVLMGVVPTLVGCVSRSAYEAEVEKNQHLQFVKTEQDIERDGLHADVGALRRAYSELSLRTTFLEGLAQQTVNELKGIDAKLLTLGQDLRLQQGDQLRMTTQGNETMRLLESLTVRQEETRIALQGVVGKLEGMKKTISPRSVDAGRAAHSAKSKVKEESQDGVGTPSRTAVQPALEQKLSQSPSTGASGDAPGGPGNDKKEVVGTQGGVGDSKPAPGSEKDPAVSSLSPSTVMKPSGLGVSGKDSTLPEGAAKSDQDPVVKKTEVPASPIKDGENEERSPLISSSGGEKPAGAGTPIKKSWGEWASDQWNSAKAKVIGPKPVQTAAGASGSESATEKK